MASGLPFDFTNATFSDPFNPSSPPPAGSQVTPPGGGLSDQAAFEMFFGDHVNPPPPLTTPLVNRDVTSLPTAAQVPSDEEIERELAAWEEINLRTRSTTSASQQAALHAQVLAQLDEKKTPDQPSIDFLERTRDFFRFGGGSSPSTPPASSPHTPQPHPKQFVPEPPERGPYDPLRLDDVAVSDGDDEDSSEIHLFHVVPSPPRTPQSRPSTAPSGASSSTPTKSVLSSRRQMGTLDLSDVLFEELQTIIPVIPPGQFRLCMQQTNALEREAVSNVLSRITQQGQAIFDPKQRAENLLAYFLLRQARILLPEPSLFSSTVSTQSLASRWFGIQTELDKLVELFERRRSELAQRYLLQLEQEGISPGDEEYDALKSTLEGIGSYQTKILSILEKTNGALKYIKKASQYLQCEETKYLYPASIEAALLLVQNEKDKLVEGYNISRSDHDLLGSISRSLAEIRSGSVNVDELIKHLEKAIEVKKAESKFLDPLVLRVDHWKKEDGKIEARERLLEEARSELTAKQAKEAQAREAKRLEETAQRQKEHEIRQRIAAEQSQIQQWQAFKTNLFGFIKQLTALADAPDHVFVYALEKLILHVAPTSGPSVDWTPSPLVEVAPEVARQPNDFAQIRACILRLIRGKQGDPKEARDYIVKNLLGQNGFFNSNERIADAQIRACNERIRDAGKSSSPSPVSPASSSTPPPSPASSSLDSLSSTPPSPTPPPEPLPAEVVKEADEKLEGDALRRMEISEPVSALELSLQRQYAKNKSLQSLTRHAKALEAELDVVSGFDEISRNLIYLEAASKAFKRLTTAQKLAYVAEGASREEKNEIRIELGKTLFHEIRPAGMYEPGKGVLTLEERVAIVTKARDGRLRNRLETR